MRNMSSRGPYDFWHSALQGNPLELVRDVAKPGFYRNKRRGWDPIAIWQANGKTVAMVGAKGRIVDGDEEFCERYFAWCAKHPVSEQAYREFCATGKWHDDVPETKVDRSNAEPHFAISETIAELKAEAEAWLKSIGGVVQTKEQADKAANFADRFAELEKDAEKARVAEKEPVLKAQRDIDGKWQPIKSAGDAAKRWAKGLITKYLAAEQARKAAEVAAKAAGGEAVRPDDLKVKAGTRGRTVSLRTERKPEVTNFDELWKHYENDQRFRLNPDVTKALVRVAELDLNAGREVPGAKITEKQVAA
jgi:hypothetical protein